MPEPVRKRRKRGGIAMNVRGDQFEAVYNVPKSKRRDPDVRESYTARGNTEAQAEANLLARLRGLSVPAPQIATDEQEQEVRTWLGPDGKDFKGARPAKPAGQTGTTLNQWAEEWLSTWLTGVQDSTRDIYTSHVKHHILPYLGEYQLNDITAKVLMTKWWTPLAALRKVRAGETTDEPLLGDSARANVYKTLRMLITTAHHKLGTRVSLTESLIPIPTTSRPESDREIKRIAKKLRELIMDNPDRNDTRWPLFALVLLGLRQSERLGIRVQDIDLTDPDDQVILLHQQLDFRKGKGWYLKPTLKNGEPRTVPLWGIFKEAVERQLELRKQWQAQPDWNPEPKFADLLFLQEGGKLWTRHQDTPAWKAYIGENLRGHSARHATGYLLAEDGISEATAKILLGHKSDAMATYYRIASTRNAHSELTRAATKRRNARVINYPRRSA